MGECAVRSQSGIYKIENTVNGKCYIGSAVNLTNRLNKHRSTLRKGTHPSPILTSAWKKYGEEAFSFRVLLFCDVSLLLFYEQLVMSQCAPAYNIRLIAMSNLGLKHRVSPHDKRRTSLLGNTHTLGYRHTEQAKLAMSSKRKGVPHSEAWKRKIGRSHIGITSSLESIVKMSVTKRLRHLIASADLPHAC